VPGRILQCKTFEPACNFCPLTSKLYTNAMHSASNTRTVTKPSPLLSRVSSDGKSSRFFGEGSPKKVHATTSPMGRASLQDETIRALEAEKYQLAAQLLEESESRVQAQRELEELKADVQKKASAQKLEDETLATRVGECMQRLFKAEEEMHFVRRSKESAEDELKKLKQEMENKEQEANEVCKALKKINEQLISSLEDERKEADRKLKAALDEAAEARDAAQAAFEDKAKSEEAAHEASIRARASSEESELTARRLEQELQQVQRIYSDLKVSEARMKDTCERLQRESEENLAARRVVEAGKEELSAALQQKECQVIEKQGQSSSRF